MRRILFLFALLCAISAWSQTLPHPAEFLGYEPGTRFTPHHRIVAYFEKIATVAGDKVKLKYYGQTQEGRPLMVALLSSPYNINKIDQIQKLNLGLTIGNTKPEEKSPAIVWLSYNVHGNEPSSSEAAMVTLYELLNPANANAQKWLENTVVIIDPCLNPDGRDRYVNWYNGMLGETYNTQLAAREHQEPWPGGRLNHYYFDLNRDWAWQTQDETRKRVALFQQWMPQVHVDFHEQLINSPYYFAPAAEPMHEVITAWQKKFQTAIGKNHARYFDANGWLYFTKEVFDLFYPSYGDTYPMFNGAIGMTYEQAGHSQGGLAVTQANGNILTLTDRIRHHVTTGLSTVEISAQQRQSLLNEFKTYFDNARNTGVGEYKTYVIKQGANRESLQQLLNQNGITYGMGNSGTFKGYNYFNAKEETFQLTSSDWVISACQPKSALLKVLFEPVSKLADSVTYDITSWSLPFVYGLQCYALRDKLIPSKAIEEVQINNTVSEPYAFLVNLQSYKSRHLLASLLKNKIKVRFAEKTFTTEGVTYQPGTLIITRADNINNPEWNSLVVKAANEDHIAITPVSTGFSESGFDLGSEKAHLINPPKIVLLSGADINPNALGEIWHFLDKQIQYPVTLINTEDFNSRLLKEYNTLILVDGNYRFLSDSTTQIELKQWVSNGGKIIALESAVAQMADAGWGIQKKKTEEKKEEGKDSAYSMIKKFESREREALGDMVSGSIYKTEIDNTHPLAFGYPNFYFTLKQNTDVYEFLGNGGWNVGIIKQNSYISGFTGSRSRYKLKDGLLFGVQDMGRGTVVYLTDNILFRSFWENGKQMLSNAIFFTAQ